MSLFSPKPCPYCGEHTFRFWLKTNINPWFGRACPTCGGKVTIPWFVRFIVALSPIVAMVTMFEYYPSKGDHYRLIVQIGILLIVYLIAILLDFFYTPLKQKHPN